MNILYLRVLALLLLGVKCLAEVGQDPSPQPTWSTDAPLAPENPECEYMNVLLEANTTSERCRVCYSTPNCAFCIAHRSQDAPFPAPECLQLRDLDTEDHCSIQEAWFPGRLSYRDKYGGDSLPTGKSRDSRGGPGFVHQDIRFCDDIYAPDDPFMASAFQFFVIVYFLCPALTCVMYCCAFVRPCPFVPPKVPSQYKYAIEKFFNSNLKYGFPGTDGSLKSNYWQYIYNQDEFLSILYSHPLNPYGRVKRALSIATQILWKCFFVLMFTNSCKFGICDKGRPNPTNVFLYALVLSLITVPVTVLLEEFARARILHMIGCGVCLAERLSVVFMTIFFVLVLFAYGSFYNGTPTSNFSSGAIALSILQSWFLKHIVLRLNFTSINSWKGGCLCLPQLRQAPSIHAGAEDELESVEGKCSIFSCSPVAFLIKNILYGIGDSTFYEDKKKFFDEKGVFSSIDEYLDETNFGKIDLSRNTFIKSVKNEIKLYGHWSGYVLDKDDNLVPKDMAPAEPALARTSRSSIEMCANTTTRNQLHSHSKRLSSSQKQWRYIDGTGQVYGDFTIDDMRQYFEQGYLDYSSPVQHSTWSQFYDIQQAFSGMPVEKIFAFVPVEGGVRTSPSSHTHSSHDRSSHDRSSHSHSNHGHSSHDRSSHDRSSHSHSNHGHSSHTHSSHDRSSHSHSNHGHSSHDRSNHDRSSHGHSSHGQHAML